MKRMTYFVMALALVLGFTQCKKEQVHTPENETKTVNITLNVGGNGGGSRHDINTTTGAVYQDNPRSRSTSATKAPKCPCCRATM